MANLAEYIVRVADQATNVLNRITGANNVLQRGFNQTRLMAGRLGASISNSFRQAAAEIPMLGSAIRSLTNPIALVGGAVVGLGLLFSSATAKGAEFNTEFRNLQNLNLDKSISDLNRLKKTVLNNAYSNGFNSSDTTQSFFNVQSVTGKYGHEVDLIVEKQGEFAKLMQADFNNYIEGTAKSMVNFGFGADKLDAFNRSAYATVKVGAISFDQLSKVQSVFAGAAASARQEFDSANKMLTLFTLKTKSADEAATLTKSLFNDLLKKSTIDAFTNVGISIYDTKGNIKQVDTLLLELNRKFSQAGNNKAIINLKNQFTGSEGLIALVQAATDQSGGLINTLTSFDETKFGLNKALDLAKQDINYINDKLKNQLDILKIQTSDATLPAQVWFAGLKKDVLTGATAMISPTTTGEQQGAEYFRKAAHSFTGMADLPENQFDAKLEGLRYLIESERKVAENLQGWNWLERNVGDPMEFKRLKAANDTYYDLLTGFEKQVLADFRAKQNGLNTPTVIPLNTDNKSGKTTPDGLKKDITDAATGGTRSTNIYINIAKLQGSENIVITDSKEGKTEIEDNVIDALTRALTIAQSNVR